MYLFILAVLGLRCCVGFPPGAARGLLFVAMCRLLTVVASLVEHRL